MAESISPEEFIKESNVLPVIDVRSPAEYFNAHIPGAINIPLFNNEERAKIGTLYKNEGKDIAVLNGLKIVGPKLYDFAKSAIRLNSPEILVHCWRGGMRSASMAWLFETAGLKCRILSGGYKAYRNYVLETFGKPLRLIVIGGMTGSGKTEILQQLKKAGEQVLDLEGLANHKGSAFGAMGQEAQPKTEHFENLLHHEILGLDPQKPVWTEDESRNIGKVFIPEGLWNQMKQAPLLIVDTDYESRVKRLYRDYACFDTELIKQSVSKIEKRLGREKCREALEACENNDLEKALRICLAYYDKLYGSQIESKPKCNGFDTIGIQGLDTSLYIEEIIEKGHKILKENERNQ